MSPDYIASKPEWFHQPRLLPLSGAHNVRDLGGYPAADGRYTAWGKVYRSDDLKGLTPDDVDALARLPVRTTVDFRAVREAEAAPDCPIPTVVNAVHLPIEPGNATSFRQLFRDMTAEKGERLMCEIYRRLVTDFQDTWRRFFAILMNANTLPVLFHCSGGKDRTGFASAMFLSALGVSREAVTEDYMMSLGPAHAKYGREMHERPELAPMLTIKPCYLQSAFDAIDDGFGGVMPYLTGCIGVDIGLMRELYTTDDPRRQG